MKKILVTVLAVGVLGLLMTSLSSAQFYGYYSPYLVGPPPKPAPSAAGPPYGPKRSMYYRLSPDPLLYWKWNHHNAFLDFQEFQRSPINPESDLSYMLRTF